MYYLIIKIETQEAGMPGPAVWKYKNNGTVRAAPFNSCKSDAKSIEYRKCVILEKEDGKPMNFNDKKTRRIIAIIIVVVIVAMVATTVIPYLMV